MTLREQVLKAAAFDAPLLQSSPSQFYIDAGRTKENARLSPLIEALAECAEILEMLRPLYLDMDELCDDVEAALANLEALLKDVK